MFCLFACLLVCQITEAARPPIEGTDVCISIINEQNGEHIAMAHGVINHTGFYKGTLEYDYLISPTKLNFGIWSLIATPDTGENNVTITISHSDYYNTNPLTFNNTFFFEAHDPSQECFLNHTFYLTPIEKDKNANESIPSPKEYPKNESKEVSGGTYTKNEESLDLLFPLAIIVAIAVLGAVFFLRRKN